MEGVKGVEEEEFFILEDGKSGILSSRPEIGI
jgi:hypothetical protein